jgi:hypothetical protein
MANEKAETHHTPPGTHPFTEGKPDRGSAGTTLHRINTPARAGELPVVWCALAPSPFRTEGPMYLNSGEEPLQHKAGAEGLSTPVLNPCGTHSEGGLRPSVRVRGCGLACQSDFPIIMCVIIDLILVLTLMPMPYYIFPNAFSEPKTRKGDVLSASLLHLRSRLPPCSAVLRFVCPRPRPSVRGRGRRLAWQSDYPSD